MCSLFYVYFDYLISLCFILLLLFAFGFRYIYATLPLLSFISFLLTLWFLSAESEFPPLPFIIYYLLLFTLLPFFCVGFISPSRLYLTRFSLGRTSLLSPTPFSSRESLTLNPLHVHPAVFHYPHPHSHRSSQ